VSKLRQQRGPFAVGELGGGRLEHLDDVLQLGHRAPVALPEAPRTENNERTSRT
jgi:hypothetical protein